MLTYASQTHVSILGHVKILVTAINATVAVVLLVSIVLLKLMNAKALPVHLWAIAKIWRMDTSVFVNLVMKVPSVKMKLINVKTSHA